MINLKILLTDVLKIPVDKFDLVAKVSKLDQVNATVFYTIHQFVAEHLKELIIGNDPKKYSPESLEIIDYYQPHYFLTTLPIYKIQINNSEITLILKYIHEQWLVSVTSTNAINKNYSELFNHKYNIPSEQKNGIPKEYIFKSYEKNKKEFTTVFDNSHKLYTFIYLLLNE